MAYVSRAELVARFGAEIEDLAPAPAEGEPDTVLSAAIADADAAIDARLASAYVLPLPAGAYPSLVRIAADLVRQRLYGEVAPEHVAERAKTSLEDLAAIADGTIELVADAGVVVARRAEAVFQARDQAFTRADRTGDALEGLDNY